MVIDKYKEFVVATFYIILPYFESFNDSQKLTVVSFVLNFNQNYFLQIVGYWVLLAQIGKLTQHSSNCIAWRVNFNLDMILEIKMLEDWSFGKHLF